MVFVPNLVLFVLFLFLFGGVVLLLFLSMAMVVVVAVVVVVVGEEMVIAWIYFYFCCYFCRCVCSRLAMVPSMLLLLLLLLLLQLVVSLGNNPRPRIRTPKKHDAVALSTIRLWHVWNGNHYVSVFEQRLHGVFWRAWRMINCAWWYFCICSRYCLLCYGVSWCRGGVDSSRMKWNKSESNRIKFFLLLLSLLVTDQ